MKVGFFGKLPGYGDFIQRNVSPDFTNQWDNWVLKSLESSRQHLHQQWRERYFNSPIWRFVIGNNVLAQPVSTGLVMPSVDQSGRCYPFAIICQTELTVNPFTLARKVDSMHHRCEEFMLSLLEKQRPDLEEIVDVLSDIYAELDEVSCQSKKSINGASVMELATISESNLDDVGASNESVLEAFMTKQQVDISIWSMIGEMSQTRYFSGMPPVDAYHTFLMPPSN